MNSKKCKRTMFLASELYFLGSKARVLYLLGENIFCNQSIGTYSLFYVVYDYIQFFDERTLYFKLCIILVNLVHFHHKNSVL